MIPSNIRALSPTNAEVYRFVRLQALQEQPPAFGSLPEDEPDLSEITERLIPNNDRCFFGAFQNQQLIGIVRIARYDASNEQHRAYLAGLYVLPEFRCQGYGRSLVQKALTWAVNRGDIRRVNLTVVTQQTAAISLYRSLGFQIYGTEPETFLKGGCFYDEHLMTLELLLRGNQGQGVFK
jgi:ribosomal protein S18 acetylase RimI-like enzyme